MKKLLIATCMMLGFAGIATAQTAAAKPAATTKPAALKVADKPATTAKVVKMDKPKPVAASGLKADGTPDMRLKENKAKAKAAPAVAGPTKKDGTADMRFKANKKKA